LHAGVQGDEMIKKPKKQRLLFFVLLSSTMLFYTVGIVTDLFSLPFFSIFWIISYDNAHDVVVYIAAAAAIAQTILTLTIAFNKKPKVLFPNSLNKMVIPKFISQIQEKQLAKRPTTQISIQQLPKQTQQTTSNQPQNPKAN
jgi:hypothetical protein